MSDCQERCGRCANWRRDKDIIEEKFTNKNGAFSRCDMGWCGSLATGSHDVCPRFEAIEQRKAA